MSDRLDHLLGIEKLKVQLRDTGPWAEKLRLLAESCHPRQRDFVLDPNRRVSAIVARGGGKTTGGRARFLRRMMMVPKAQCLYVATTRQQAVELMWVQLKDLVERLGIEARFNETSLVCQLTRNGSRLRLVGADDRKEIEKYRGQPFHEVGVDEGASYDPSLLANLIYRVIGPRLGDYNGVLWMIGTPGHILSGPFYESTLPGLCGEDGQLISRSWEDRDLPEFEGWTRWSRHHWSVQDGAPFVPAMERLWAEALREKASNGWTDANPIWRREYCGLWAPDDTEMVFKYRAFTDAAEPWNSWCAGRPHSGAIVPSHATLSGANPFGLPEGHDWQYVFGMDMGHSDPFALEVFAYSATTKVIYHVYEFTRRGMYARTIAEHLIGPELNHEHLGGLMRWTSWPDGMVADLAGMGGAVVDELGQVYGIAVEAAEKKNKHDAIELFNGDLVDGRVKIMRGSKLEEELLALRWDLDDNKKLREDKSQPNHCSDAAIYGRRKSLHLFAHDPLPPPPQKGSPEAVNKRLEEQEERMGRQWDSPFLDIDPLFDDRGNWEDFFK